jgi:hypothetical protein
LPIGVIRLFPEPDLVLSVIVPKDLEQVRTRDSHILILQGRKKIHKRKVSSIHNFLCE